MPTGFVLWFTGLSGSGKSTLTSMVAAELRRRGVHVETLDGDDIRKHLSRGLGFSREDRDENIRRIGFVAKLLSRSGACAIAAAISPYRDVRNEVRRSIDNFVEVYAECPLSVLAARDPKGLYKRAMAGEIRGFTGVDDPYEAPADPEIHLRTDHETPEQSLARILLHLEDEGLIPAWGRLLDSGESTRVAALTAPHGRDLVSTDVEPAASAAARARAESLPTVDCDDATLAHLQCIASGAYSPLRGFMTRKDLLRVLREMRLENGLPWSLPVILGVPRERESELQQNGEIALRDAKGSPVATLAIEDVFAPDDAFPPGTDSQARFQGRLCVGGTVRTFAAIRAPGCEQVRPPREVRDQLSALRWRSIVAFQPDPSASEPAERAMRGALELFDGLLVQPAATPSDATHLEKRLASLELLLAESLRAGGAVLAPVPLFERPGRRRAIHGAILAKNHGATHVVVDDSASGGQSAFDCYGAGEIGIDVLAPSGGRSTSGR